MAKATSAEEWGSFFEAWGVTFGAPGLFFEARGLTFGGPGPLFAHRDLTLAPHGVQSSKMTRMTDPTWAPKVLRRLPGDPPGAMEGTLGMFFEIQSRIADFPKIMVLLGRGHDFRGFGGLENLHFRSSKASKKASDEIWVQLRQEEIDKKTILAPSRSSAEIGRRKTGRREENE